MAKIIIEEVSTVDRGKLTLVKMGSPSGLVLLGEVQNEDPNALGRLTAILMNHVSIYREGLAEAENVPILQLV